MKYRVGIIDDSPAAVLGLTAIINAEPDMHVVASGSTPRALLHEDSDFGVVILNLAPGDPHAAAHAMRILAPATTSVVAYVGADQSRLVRDAAKAGAAAVIYKTDHPRRITQTLRVVLGSAIPSTRRATASTSLEDAGLSAREREVLSLYAAGETAERVASELFLSRETVIDHIRRIRAKYAAAGRPARNRIDLFRRAVEDGFVPPN
ncbi:response regulator transcription factor [Microbacterium sp. SSM24]|uniref:response regulator transcription factor n=1 Tax=Microbacterium sp. SSM24 TaxID=2991714 RepID=UPI0022276E30|nr:LuxR C-terminal-related transcriptional regulator [Microbacterium sp. SSM24]MCW3494661.1 LuxR C-terminal-related transcriptional regulator [Microbacterium sp. SSM24]